MMEQSTPRNTMITMKPEIRVCKVLQVGQRPGVLAFGEVLVSGIVQVFQSFQKKIEKSVLQDATYCPSLKHIRACRLLVDSALVHRQPRVKTRGREKRKT